MTATATRRVIFAGDLGPNDWSSADGLVTVDRRQRDALAHLPPEIAQRFRDIAGSLPAGDSIFASGEEPYGSATRSPRPACLLTVLWHANYAGLGIEDVAARHGPAAAAKADEAGLPPGDLEMWLLPVVDATFQFLITPADEPEAGQ